MIGHELTTVHGLDHAQTLAVILLAVRRTEKAQKLLQYAERVWGIEEGMSYPYSMRLMGALGGLNQLAAPARLKCPIFYAYGRYKLFQFLQWLQRIEAGLGCKAVTCKSSHWVMRDCAASFNS